MIWNIFIVSNKVPFSFYIEINFQVEELLDLWKDEQQDHSDLRTKLINTLKKYQRAGSCQALIIKLQPLPTIVGSPRCN